VWSARWWASGKLFLSRSIFSAFLVFRTRKTRKALIYIVEVCMSKKTHSEAGKIGADKSRAIQAKKKLERIEVYDKSPKCCLHCNKPIPYDLRRSKFCDHSCSATYTNTNRKNKKTPCEVCGKLKSHAFRCCGTKCSHKLRHTEFIAKWLRGEEDGVIVHGMEVSEHIRKWLKANRGGKCEICGWNEINPTSNKCPLHVDHIDGNPLNNKPDNLRLLCPNHHSLTPTYGSLNKGRGRKFRYDKSLW
jgi:hypothetical protein